MWAIYYYLLVHLVLFRGCHAYANTNMSQLFTLIGCDTFDIDTMVAHSELMIQNTQTKIDGVVSADFITAITPVLQTMLEICSTLH